MTLDESIYRWRRQVLRRAMGRDPGECEICRALPDKIEIHGDWYASSGELPPAYERLEVVAGQGPFQRLRLLRCPRCDAWYRYEYDQDYNLWEETLQRITTVEGLDRLRSFPGGTDSARAEWAAEREWLEARYEAELAAFERGLSAPEAAARRRAAGELAQHHARREAWTALEALLNVEDFEVRDGAAGALGWFLRYEGWPLLPPATVVHALVAALAPADPGQADRGRWVEVATTGEAARPALTALVAGSELTARAVRDELARQETVPGPAGEQLAALVRARLGGPG